MAFRRTGVAAVTITAALCACVGALGVDDVTYFHFDAGTSDAPGSTPDGLPGPTDGAKPPLEDAFTAPPLSSDAGCAVMAVPSYTQDFDGVGFPPAGWPLGGAGAAGVADTTKYQSSPRSMMTSKTVPSVVEATSFVQHSFESPASDVCVDLYLAIDSFGSYTDAHEIELLRLAFSVPGSGYTTYSMSLIVNAAGQAFLAERGAPENATVSAIDTRYRFSRWASEYSFNKLSLRVGLASQQALLTLAGTLIASIRTSSPKTSTGHVLSVGVVAEGSPSGVTGTWAVHHDAIAVRAAP